MSGFICQEQIEIEIALKMFKINNRENIDRTVKDIKKQQKGFDKKKKL